MVFRRERDTCAGTLRRRPPAVSAGSRRGERCKTRSYLRVHGENERRGADEITPSLVGNGGRGHEQKNQVLFPSCSNIHSTSYSHNYLHTFLSHTPSCSKQERATLLPRNYLRYINAYLYRTLKTHLRQSEEREVVDQERYMKGRETHALPIYGTPMHTTLIRTRHTTQLARVNGDTVFFRAPDLTRLLHYLFYDKI